jgi:hypothetical protein
MEVIIQLAVEPEVTMVHSGEKPVNILFIPWNKVGDPVERLFLAFSGRVNFYELLHSARCLHI